MLKSLIVTLILILSDLATAQSWTPVNNQPPVPLGQALLLTDGTVMVQQMAAGGFGTGQWWRLTPDIFGSYINGTWSQLASMPSGYGPLYYASAVLADGRVVVVGGEFNLSNNTQVEANLGAIYTPATNLWTSLNPPNGVANIGDAASVVLPNGTLMIGDCCSSRQYLLDPATLTWTLTGSGKADSNSEEGWTLLPSGNVLAVDTQNGTNSEAYNPSSGTWASVGSTIVALSDGSPNFEIGPAVLRPDGTVFAIGGTPSTAIYNSASGSWSIGPSFPNNLDIADGPAAVLPNGNVLVDSSPGLFNSGSSFFEFNGTSLIGVPGPPNAPNDSSFVGRMLVLPTGQIFFTDQSAQVEIYTSTGTFEAAWQPAITSVSSTLTTGSRNNVISGRQFNGLSQGAAYGDDSQSATNYPLIRITNNSSGHVKYAQTHGHSTMAVATGPMLVSTTFDVPSNTESGPSTIQVVANGIPSNPVGIQIVSPQNTTCTPDSFGYCIASRTSSVHTTVCFTDAGFRSREVLGAITWGILTPDGVETFSENFFDDGSGSCSSIIVWNPEEPAVFFGDPNLP